MAHAGHPPSQLAPQYWQVSAADSKSKPKMQQEILVLAEFFLSNAIVCPNGRKNKKIKSWICAIGCIVG
jgi:hypothetical protein